ncbi:MAG: MarR family transcriptional regulator [Pseudomonadota bacterium]
MPDGSKTTPGVYFALFNEIGIIAQLSRALFEARLPDGLLTPHFSVINHMVRLGDGKTPLDLARAFQVPKTTMTHSLSILEKHGFVRITKNPDDGRSKCVFLTDTGRAFREDAIRLLGPDLAAMASEIDAEDVVSLLPHLEAIRKYLDANRP